MEQKVPNLETLQTIARELVFTLKPTDVTTLVTLSGELGAGKTTFIQMIGKELGVSEPMVSPTFVLEKIYELDGTKGFSKLVHIDAYRLKSGEELTALGFSELVRDGKNIILLEWPEMVADVLPKATIVVSLAVDEDGTRTYNAQYG